jgi:multicomponent Na+:H+ antiporter subunit D
MRALLSLPIVLPLLAAAVSIAAGRSRNLQRIIGVGTLTAVTVISAVLLVRVDDRGISAMQVGDWEAPIGITLVADRLAAIMLLVAMAMLLAVLVFAIGQPGAENRHVGFHPVYLVMAAGIAMAFLTGDLFNLFVAFEITLMSSYVLITLGGRPEQVRSGMTYVVISLIASALFLMMLAFVYAATGTVNMADLNGEIAALSPGLRSAIAVFTIAVFGIKAAIFPLFFWLPDSYPTAPTPVTAVFAGLLTKVGVYALIRTQMVLIPPDSRPGTLLLVVAALTMVVGVFGAIAQNDMKRILSFHIVSQIGYMIMGLGLFTLAGLAGVVLYVVHHIVVKTTLFLVTGLVEHDAGTGRLDRIGGLAKLKPVLGVLFIIPALSLAGIPPMSGFVAKLALVDAGMGAREYLVVGVSLAVSLFTLFSMTKIWVNGFWGEPQVAPEPDYQPFGTPHRWMMIGATASLIVISLGVSLWAGPLYELSERAAVDLVDANAYVSAVLGR